MKRSSIGRVVLGCVVAVVATEGARAQYTPVSANRVVNGGVNPTLTSNAFGTFMQSQSGSVMGAGSQPQTLTAGASQNSLINDALTSPAVKFNGGVSGNSSGGSSTAQFVNGLSSLTFVFSMTTAGTLTHSLVDTRVGMSSSATATLTPAGGSAINLLAPGFTSASLSSGTQYTLFLRVSGTTSGTLNSASYNESLVGNIEIVPAPGAGAMGLGAGLLAMRRRRLGS